MRTILLFVLFVLSNISFAQDKETRAQSAYMAAETAYNEGDYAKAVQKLSDATALLGKSNAKIEYMRVKSLVEQKKYTDAQAALGKYFEYATNAKGTEKYNEMMKLVSELEDKAEIEKAAVMINPFLEEFKNALAADKEYTYLHAAIQKYYGTEDAYKDSIAAKKAAIVKPFKVRKSKTDPVVQSSNMTLQVMEGSKVSGRQQYVTAMEYDVSITGGTIPVLMHCKAYGICESVDNGKTWTYFSYGYLPSRDYPSEFVLNPDLTVPEAQFTDNSPKAEVKTSESRMSRGSR